MKKLAVVFPGRRYSCDRSLLFYPSRILSEDGYEMVYLHYDLPKEAEDPRPLDSCADECLTYALDKVKDIDFAQYDSIVFLSKSVGAVVSGSLANMKNLSHVHQILITPIEPALPYIRKDDLIISSDSDKYFPEAKIKLSSFNNAYFFPGFPHSFEIEKNYSLTIRALANVVGIAEKYIQAIDESLKQG
ncbi:MAG: hypothetical protein LKM30_03260 [Bacilli bacterium]|jgi:hypothetical protein|nr:hypothetical protein [Bacilli bacterium]